VRFEEIQEITVEQ